MNIPALTLEQMIEVDRLMVTDYGIEMIQMMENAGRNLADLARQLFGATLSRRTVCVVCGRGNNGGGGMVAARHLQNRGTEVHVMRLEGPLKIIPEKQWRTLGKMGLQNEKNFDLSQADLIIDSLIGYGLKGEPREEVTNWIEKINTAGRPVIALDAPSGLDTSSGTPSRFTVQAKATMTLGLPKIGLLTKSAQSFVGKLFLADISIPSGLYSQIGLDVGNIFEKDSIITLRE